MTESVVFSWDFLLYPLLAFIYLELLQWMNNRAASTQRLSLEEILSNYAKSREMSEYDVFHLASGSWSVSRHQVDADFNTYLQTLVLPYYVRDFVRKIDQR